MMRSLFHSWRSLGVLALAGVLTAGAGSLVASSGCTVLTNDALPDDAGVFEAGEASVSTCNACVVNECTATWAMCLTDPSCLAIRGCSSGMECGIGCKTACACNATSDAGLAPDSIYRAFTTCNDARTCGATCGSDCAGRCLGDAGEVTTPGPCNADDAGAPDGGDAEAADASVDAGDGGDGGVVPTGPTAESCAQCASNKCGDSKKACAIGTECASFLECAFACVDSACVDECGRLHATGKVAAVELATCTQAGCEDECGLVNR